MSFPAHEPTQNLAQLPKSTAHIQPDLVEQLASRMESTDDRPSDKHVADVLRG